MKNTETNRKPVENEKEDINNYSNGCGPIQHPGMTVECTEEGIQVKGFVFTNSNSKPEPWSAEWIWLSRESYPEHQTAPYTDFCPKEDHRFGVALLRKEVMLNMEMQRIKAWVSGDRKYRLYINGRLAGRGPAEAGGDWGNQDPLERWFYDCYDLTSLFCLGKNVIAVEVALQTDVQADYSMGQGGFLFEAEFIDSQGQRSLVKTDNSWRGILGEAFRSFCEYDARKEPVGWRQAGYDDSWWPHVEVVSTAYDGPWNLVPREIPPLMEVQVLAKKVIVPFEEFQGRIVNPDAMISTDNAAAIITPGSPMTFWVDFGKEVVGHVQFTVKGASGSRIILDYEEIPGKSHRTESYILREGLQSYEVFRLNGFQYLRVSTGYLAEPLEILQISNTFTSYPVTYQGEFNSSDEFLNEIWKVGRWTNQICMQGYHLDSPIHQEALGCTGDYLIESLINYYTFGDRWLTRQDILRTAWLLDQKEGFMFHTSYSLMWIQMAIDYYDYTGDGEVLREIAPTVHMLLDLFESYKGESGLIDHPPSYMFMDWVQVGEFNLHHPPRVMGQGYMSALYYQALRNGIRISKYNGNIDRANLYKRRAEGVKRAFNEMLWMEERGLYCDGRPGTASVESTPWLPADVEGIFFSQHTNSLAVLYDLAPRQCHAELMRRVLEDKTLTQAQPYFMHFVLEALCHAGLFEQYGLKQIRRWKVLLEEHDTSLKEVWSGFDCDYSHAWGGTPTYQLSARVLGVTPAEPGFYQVEIKPVLGDLKWACGKVPTPYGIIVVNWSRVEYGLKMEVSIPEDSGAKIWLPKMGLKSVMVLEGGETIWSKNSFIGSVPGISGGMESDQHVLLEVASGSYCLELSGVK